MTLHWTTQSATTNIASVRYGFASHLWGALTAVAALLLFSAASTEGACPTGIPGYTLSLNLVVDGGDLGGPFSDVQSAISDCSPKADCTGVAGSGTAFVTKKVSMIPTSASVGACLYVKLPTVCPPLANYASIADVDSQGAATSGFSAGGPITSARAACEPQQDCLGFDSKTFTARSSLFPMVYSRGTCFYVKLPSRCPDVNGYTALPDAIPTGVSSTLIDIKKPAELPGCCNKASACIGFTSSGARYSGAGATTYKRGTCWYTRSGAATTCPAVTGYTAVPDKDMAGAIIKKLSSSAAAAADCTSDATCGGFTSDGWRTRKNATKMVDAYTNCFYRKDVIDMCASADVSVNCTNTPGGFTEDCAPGYENYNSTARTCSDIDECLSPSVTVVCTNTPGNFTEVCASGYENYDEHCRTCSDIDECAKADASVNCTNTDGNFTEVCATGYENYNATSRTCDASSSPPCPSVQGFNFIYNKDVPASSILTKTLDELSYTDADQCNALGACISFSTSGPSNATSSDFIDSPGTCAYTRKYMEGGCEALWGEMWQLNTTMVPDTAYILGYGPYSTPQEAHDACSGSIPDVTCFGWTNDGRLFEVSYANLIEAPGRCMLSYLP